MGEPGGVGRKKGPSLSVEKRNPSGLLWESTLGSHTSCTISRRLKIKYGDGGG